MRVETRRTQRFGASVGDMFMSLIHTAQLRGETPFDFLTELQRHAKAAAENPADWLPVGQPSDRCQAPIQHRLSSSRHHTNGGPSARPVPRPDRVLGFSRRG